MRSLVTLFRTTYALSFPSFPLQPYNQEYYSGRVPLVRACVASSLVGRGIGWLAGGLVVELWNFIELDSGGRSVEEAGVLWIAWSSSSSSTSSIAVDG